MSAIASRLAATNSPVRLQVVDKNNALDAIKDFLPAKRTWLSRALTSAICQARRPLLSSHAVWC
jgi:hypothetical protein